jgi:hypothetical protein
MTTRPPVTPPRETEGGITAGGYTEERRCLTPRPVKERQARPVTGSRAR